MKILIWLYRYIKYFVLNLKYGIFCIKSADIFAFCDSNKVDSLFITHNFRGGTAQFEKNFLQEQNENFLILRIISYLKKDFEFCIENNGEKFFVKPNELKTLLKYHFKKIVVNSLASSYSSLQILDLLTEYKNINSKSNLIYFVHDFHCVCPKFNLVANEFYCRLNCSKFGCKFSLFPERTTATISEWRTTWGNFLQKCNEIRCFSTSSKTIIRTAYPNLLEEKVSVIPHDMSYCNFQKIEGIEKLPLNIGIIGDVSTVPKGKLVVQELLKRLPETIPITFIGVKKRQIGISRKNIKYLGKYRHDELPNLIKKSTISMGIFPSIWSETFSYLVSEQILLGLPLICFDIGAQADKVREYEKGFVVKDIDEMIALINNWSKNAL